MTTNKATHDEHTIEISVQNSLFIHSFICGNVYTHSLFGYMHSQTGKTYFVIDFVWIHQILNRERKHRKFSRLLCRRLSANTNGGQRKLIFRKYIFNCFNQLILTLFRGAYDDIFIEPFWFWTMSMAHVDRVGKKHLFIHSLAVDMLPQLTQLSSSIDSIRFEWENVQKSCVLRLI